QDRRAAVLVGLLRNPHTDNFEVILTERSLRLRTHGGEVALPGGRKDDTDPSLLHTALRESAEEIGLDPTCFHHLATFDPLVSKHQLLVTPIVGLITQDPSKPPISFLLNPDEVEHVFKVPLEFFLSGNCHRHMQFGVWRAHGFDWNDPEHGRTFLIFGLTAAILVNIAIVAFGRPPEFETIPNTLRPQMNNTSATITSSSKDSTGDSDVITTNDTHDPTSTLLSEALTPSSPTTSRVHSKYFESKI
ncbi:hypothetical protein HDU76_010660, partial [Blyttiomyces sp. JEL0837]